MPRKVGEDGLLVGCREDVARGGGSGLTGTGSGDQGIPAVDVYGSGPLEKEATHAAAAAGAFLATLAAVVGPSVLAYIAGTNDSAGKITCAEGCSLVFIVSVITPLFLFAIVWGCCCRWNTKIGCRNNLLGPVLSFALGFARKDDLHESTHADAVAADVKKLSSQQNSMVDPSALMRKHDLTREELSVPSTTGAHVISVRIYRPSGRDQLPCLVWLHGGGWVVGGTYGNTLNSPGDMLAAEFAGRCRCVVVYVDYRLAPQHKFPAAPDDCLDVLRWTVSDEGTKRLSIDTSRVAVGGDSAGGNLSCVLAHDALAEAIPLAHQLLVYPATSARVHWFKSWRENQNQPVLSARLMLWFWAQYLGKYEDSNNPRAAPLEARSCKGLCPATIITAEFDPLRDEGIAYFKRLQKDGVRVKHKHYAGAVHGFLGNTMMGKGAQESMTFAVEELKQAFA